MGYTKLTWADDVALSADNLAHLESQADALDAEMLAVDHSVDYYTISEYASNFFNVTAMGPGSDADADTLGGMTKAQVLAASVPVNTVIMWHGNIASPPAGFLYCNGSQGAPDMRNLLPFGGNYNVKTTGGSAITKWTGSVTVASCTLTIQQLPNHVHAWNDMYPSVIDQCTYYATPLATGNVHYCLTSFVGGGGAHSSNVVFSATGNEHDNYPLCKAVHFLIKT